MVRISSAIAIRRPANKVFEYITNPANSPIWHSDVLSDSGRPGLPAGSHGTLTILVLGQHTIVNYEIMANNERDTLSIRSTQGPLRYSTTAMVTPIETGSCRVSLETEMEISTVFRLATSVLQSMVEEHMAADLERLKQTMEALVA